MVLCVEEVHNLFHAFPTVNDHESIIHVPKPNFYAQTFQFSHNLAFQSIDERVSEVYVGPNGEPNHDFIHYQINGILKSLWANLSKILHNICH